MERSSEAIKLAVETTLKIVHVSRYGHVRIPIWFACLASTAATAWTTAAPGDREPGHLCSIALEQAFELLEPEVREAIAAVPLPDLDWTRPEIPDGWPPPGWPEDNGEAE